MLALLALLVIVALFFGGLAVKGLLLIAVVLLALWAIGWLAHPAGRRWYHW